MHSEHSDLLRDTPSDSELLPATPSHCEWGGAEELRATQSYSKALRAAAQSSQSRTKNSELLRANPSYSNASELLLATPSTPSTPS